MLSIPEGDDKVPKYPLMFSTCDALVMNKYDMMPYFEFDDKRVESDEKGVNPKASVFRVSSKDDKSLDDLLSWMTGMIDEVTNEK